MTVSVEKLPHSRVRLRVEVPASDVQPYFESAARELSKEHPAKGFRPGTAPLAVMRSVVGDAAVAERALRSLVQKTYVETLLERPEVEAVGPPEVEVESAPTGGPCVYRATVAVLPEVRLGNYRSIRLTKAPVHVTPADVDRELEILRKMRASYLTVPRAAARGDRVEVRIAHRVGGTTADGAPEETHAFLLGESVLLPGLEEQLLGMREGEAKAFTLTVPATHERADLREQTLAFRVAMGVVQQRVLPVLDDAFARGLGKFGGLADLRTQLIANLQAEQEEHAQARFVVELLEQVVRGATYGEFPEVLVERELDTCLTELREGVAALGLPFDTYLQQVRKTAAEVRTGLKESALRRLRAGLALRALARAEKIIIKEEEVDAEVNGALQNFHGSVQDAERDLDLQSLREAAAGAVRNRKVFAVLEAIAAGETPPAAAV